MTSKKEAIVFSTWSTVVVVVKGLSAFYSRWFRLCRDGVLCFLICVSVLFCRAVGTPSKEKVHQSQSQHFIVHIMVFGQATCKYSKYTAVYIASNGIVTCLGLKQYCHPPPGQVTLVCLLPPYHLFSVPSSH